MGYSTFELYMEIFTYESRGSLTLVISRAYQLKSYRKSKATPSSSDMTLCHVSKLWPTYQPLSNGASKKCKNSHDVEDILLIRRKSYDLIDGMFATLSKLQTRKVNIGMDEAHLVGLGQILS